MISDTFKSSAEETQEKHVPDIVVLDDGQVKVICGRDVLHPSTAQHYIKWLKLYGVNEDGLLIELGSVEPMPEYAAPAGTFQVDLEGMTALHAMIYCNLHGLWQNELEL